MKNWSTSKVLVSGFAFFAAFLVVGARSLFAQDGSAGTTEMDVIKWIGIASGFGLGLAAIGGAYGQGKLVASAMEGIARNPEAADKMFTPLILGLAFIEALTIYALVFGFVFKLLVLG